MSEREMRMTPTAMREEALAEKQRETRAMEVKIWTNE